MNSFLTIESFIIDADLASIDSLIENTAPSEMVLESENADSNSKKKTPISEKMRSLGEEFAKKAKDTINKLIQIAKNLIARVVNFISKIKTKKAGTVKVHKDLISSYKDMKNIASDFLFEVSKFDDIQSMIIQDKYAIMFSDDTTYNKLLKIKDLCAQKIIKFKEKDILDDNNIEEFYNKENINMSDYIDFDVTNETKILSEMEKTLNKKKISLEFLNTSFKTIYYMGYGFVSSSNRNAMKLINSMVGFQNYLISGCSKIFFRMQFYLNTFIKMTPTVTHVGSISQNHNKQNSYGFGTQKALPRYT